MTMISISGVFLLTVAGALAAPQSPFVGKLPHTSRIRPSLDIYNGKTTTISKYPYIASLKKDGEQFAAAVILNENWLVTTAYVVYSASPSDFTLRVGSSDYDKLGQTLKVSKIVSHPKYTGNGWDYDIAVIKTDKPIKFGKNVKAIKALGTKKLKPGTKGSIAGWGFNSNDEIPENLLEAEVTVYSQKKCASTYISYLTPRLFCTFDENVAPCPYDYSDPLVVDDTLYGLFAGGYDCNPGSYPVLYTDVTALYKWVQGAIKDEEE